jgi:hypothetical protein
VGCHNFDTTGGSDNGDAITLAPGGGFGLDLQWAQPWNGVSSDYDVFVVDASGAVVSGSTIDNLRSQQPVEFLGYTNSSAVSQTVRIVVAKFSGQTDDRLKFVLVGAHGITGVQYHASLGGDIVGPSIFGHSGAASVGSTAAIPYTNSNTSEDYSSRGPGTLYYDDTPNVIALATPQVLNKPDFAATDNVQNTFFGPPIGGIPHFAGSSAAAPQAAAIGALLEQYDPALTATQVLATLRSTARPVTTNGAPSDVGGGYLDASAALASVVPLPAPPTGAAATPGNGQAALKWSAPATNPNFPINGYVVTPILAGVSQTPQTFASTATTATVTGLTNGSSYTFTVAARNANGAGPPSLSSPATVVGTPLAPTAVTAAPASGAATVTWTAPTNTNGSAITGYAVTTISGGVAVSTTNFNTPATSVTVPGLNNQQIYGFAVAAINAAGTGPRSATSLAITVGTPVAPTNVTVTPGNTTVTLSWTAPADNGAPITGYLITEFADGFYGRSWTFASAATTETITGLTNGNSEGYKVAAINARGTGLLSAPTPRVAIGGPSAPLAPTATPGNGSATISWTPPVITNGSPVSQYTVTAFRDGKQTANIFLFAATTTTMTGLTNASTYTFTVTARNDAGPGPPSVPSPPIIVGTPAPATNVRATPGSTTTATGPLALSFTPGADNGSAITSFTATCTSPTGGTTRVATSTSSPMTVGGATLAKTYTCTVTATNARGIGPTSTSSAPAIVGSPAAPSNTRAMSGSTTTATGPLVVSFTPGANNGSGITRFTATCTSTNGGTVRTATGTTSPITVTATTTAKSYTCTVTATNARGIGPAAVASPAVIVGTPAAPSPVTVVKVASQQLRVTFTPHANNGSATTSFTTSCVSSNGGVAGSHTGPASPITVTGLTASKTYTCTVKATNARGAGLPSTPTSPIVA